MDYAMEKPISPGSSVSTAWKQSSYRTGTTLVGEDGSSLTGF